MLEEVEFFKYLGSVMTALEGIEEEVQQRVVEGSKVRGVVRSVVKGRTTSSGKNKHCTSTVTYGVKLGV